MYSSYRESYHQSVLLDVNNAIGHHVVVKCDIFRTRNALLQLVLHIVFNSCEG